MKYLTLYNYITMKYAIIKNGIISSFSEEKIPNEVCIEYDSSFIQPKYEDGKIVEGYTPTRKEIGDAIVAKAFD